jgi:hypothetical protein
LVDAIWEDAMIKPTAVAMGVVMASLATGTYYGLDLLPPGLIPPPIGRAVAQDTVATTKAAEPVAIAQAAPEAPSPAADEAPTEQDLAEDPAPAEAAPPPAEQADAASAEAEPEPAPPAPEPAVAAAPAPAPQPAPKAAEPAAPKPAPKAEAAAPKPAPAEKPAKTDVASAAPATREPAKAPPAADAIKPWWPDPSKMPANQLKLQYAGQVKSQPAIALLFTAPLKLETVQQFAQVKNAKGETVSGQWTAGKNPALAVLNGLEPGRYTVILQPQIADQKGYMLGVTLKGPVYVKQP